MNGSDHGAVERLTALRDAAKRDAEMWRGNLRPEVLAQPELHYRYEDNHALGKIRDAQKTIDACDAAVFALSRIASLEGALKEAVEELYEIGDGRCGLNCEAERSIDNTALIDRLRSLLPNVKPDSEPTS